MLQAQIWTKVDGPSSYINKLFFPRNEPGKIVISSDQIPTNLLDPTIDFPHYGVGQNGFQISTDSGKTFGTSILKDFSIYDFLQNPANSDIWFASVRKLTEGSIAVSTDKGATWDENNLKCVKTPQILAFAAVSGIPNKYFSASVNSNKGLDLSSDDFQTCLSYEQLDIQARDVKISSLDNNLIFIGGDNSLHHIYHSYDGGKSWLGDESGLEGLRVLCILPSLLNKAVVYCGADSINQMTKEILGKGIFQSLDTGKTWKNVGAKGASVLSMVQHPLYPRYIAAACDTAGVLLSGSFGWSWEKFNAGFPDSASIRQVGFPSWDSTADGIIMFAGAYGDGLYKSKRIRTAVQEIEGQGNDFLKIISISPNPTYGALTIQWQNQLTSKVDIYVSDIFGRTISILANSYSDAGFHSINTELKRSCVSGMYVVNISDGVNIVRQKIILLP